MTVGFNPYMPQTDTLSYKGNAANASTDTSTVSKEANSDKAAAEYGAVYERSDAAKEGAAAAKEGLYSIPSTGKAQRTVPLL